ncbi:MAG: helix-turn-helix transcriptional regulator, partial [Bacilli bacterium]|nr:helix-turn-helix transcriptional regulator [Bacilli bacterium]
MYDTKLTIQERLEDLRKERGLTLEQLAEQTGLSKSALNNYETDATKDISHYAIIKLAKFYGVTSDYLLGLSEIKHHPDAELNDLHLSDGMVKLLQDGQVNTPLLCELATHKDFAKLLADIEIYVNGMAAVQIQNLNAWVDVTRAEIMEKYQPGEHDSTTYLLQSMHLQEGEYFSQRVHNDIDCIMADLKETHADRSISAPTSSVAAELKEALDEVANFKGSQLERLVMLFCKQTKIKYSKLTEEEKQWL